MASCRKCPGFLPFCCGREGAQQWSIRGESGGRDASDARLAPTSLRFEKIGGCAAPSNTAWCMEPGPKECLCGRLQTRRLLPWRTSAGQKYFAGPILQPGPLDKRSTNFLHLNSPSQSDLNTSIQSEKICIGSVFAESILVHCITVQIQVYVSKQSYAI